MDKYNSRDTDNPDQHGRTRRLHGPSLTNTAATRTYTAATRTYAAAIRTSTAAIRTIKGINCKLIFGDSYFLQSYIEGTASYFIILSITSNFQPQKMYCQSDLTVPKNVITSNIRYRKSNRIITTRYWHYLLS